MPGADTSSRCPYCLSDIEVSHPVFQRQPRLGRGLEIEILFENPKLNIGKDRYKFPKGSVTYKTRSVSLFSCLNTQLGS